MVFFQSNVYFELMGGLAAMQPFAYKMDKTSITGIQFVNGGAIKQFLSSRIIILGEPALYQQVNSNNLLNIDWQFRKQLERGSIYTELRLLEPAGNNDFFNSLHISIVSLT